MDLFFILLTYVSPFIVIASFIATLFEATARRRWQRKVLYALAFFVSSIGFLSTFSFWEWGICGDGPCITSGDQAKLLAILTTLFGIVMIYLTTVVIISWKKKIQPRNLLLIFLVFLLLFVGVLFTLFI